ncbi:MAG TPA: hypothetical protein VLB67_07380 [Acidimicrobiia bacterium]|nr:hypothetical protein [Acidimicrobiia bacterium]
MRRLLPLVVLLTACTAGGDATTTTTTTIPVTTTVAETTTTTVPPECAPPPYAVDVLPAKVTGNVVPPADVERNEYLEVPGSSSRFWLDEDGHLAVALIRGTLPLAMWPGESSIIEIDGVQARVGPFDDGSWVVGWAEPGEQRCDLFTMVFFPPVDPSEVQATLLSMDRTAG